MLPLLLWGRTEGFTIPNVDATAHHLYDLDVSSRMFSSVEKSVYLKDVSRYTLSGVHLSSVSTAALLLPWGSSREAGFPFPQLPKIARNVCRASSASGCWLVLRSSQPGLSRKFG